MQEAQNRCDVIMFYVLRLEVEQLDFGLTVREMWLIATHSSLQ